MPSGHVSIVGLHSAPVGECQLFLSLRPAPPTHPQNTTLVSVGGRSCRGGDLSGLPRMCLPRHRKQRPHGFANSGWYRAHTQYLTAQGPGVHIHCASRHALGAGVEIQARRHASQRIPGSRIYSGLSSTYFLPPCWRITAAAS